MDYETLLMLMEENRRTKERLNAIDHTLHEFYSALNELIEQIKKDEKQTDEIVNLVKNLYVMEEMQNDMIKKIQAASNNVKYEIMDPEAKKIFFPRFRSDEETLRLITEEGKSLARFGDGEFGIAFNVSRQKFQKCDSRLAKRIWEVLNSNHPNLLIGIAKHYGNLETYNEQSAYGMRLYMTEETRRQHEKILSADKVYSNAYITRPYVIYKDVFTDGPKQRFDALKKIWKNKKIIIVEGALTRLGVGNDLFSNAQTIKRIIAPATNSFDKYDEILEECQKRCDDAEMFILAIGPSSGILAYDLTESGCQAIDVGHIDLEYEWFLAGKGARVSVPNKYNNELQGGETVLPINDPLYDSQIIASFAQ